MVLDLSITEINSNTVSNIGFDMYIVDCTTGTVTLTLNNSHEGKYYWIRRIDNNGTAQLTIDALGGALVNGVPSIFVGVNSAIQLVKHNSNWLSVS